MTDKKLSAEEQRIKEKSLQEGTYLKAPNGQPTKLTEEQWLQIHTKGFKRAFGEWEKLSNVDKLFKSDYVTISGNEIRPSKDLKVYKKNALDYAKGLRGTYVNKDTGEEILLSLGNKNGGIKEVLQHDYKDIEHIQSIAAIPYIVEKAIFIDSMVNYDTDKNPQVGFYDYYVCGLSIQNEQFTVRAVIAEQYNGQRYYDHKLSRVEKGTLLQHIYDVKQSPKIIASQSVSSSVGESGDLKSSYPTVQRGGASLQPPTQFHLKDKQLLSILQMNHSQSLDENGEPLVIRLQQGEKVKYVFEDTRKDLTSPERYIDTSRPSLIPYKTISEMVQKAERLLGKDWRDKKLQLPVAPEQSHPKGKGIKH